MSIKDKFRQFIKSALPRWIMIYKLKKSNTDILFTFDDGPDPVFTPEILDILKRKKKKAIFFVIGEKALQYPEIIRRISDEGHIIGNHTHTHPHDRKTNISVYKADIEKAQEALESIIGEKPRIFRPPCGEFNLKTVYSAKRLGLSIMLMSNGGGEWNENAKADPKVVESQILRNIEPSQIIVMHDNNPKIPAMLSSLIDNIDSSNLLVATQIETSQF